MLESQVNSIQIKEEVPFEAFSTTIEYLYTDDVEIKPELAIDVLTLANKYYLPTLVQKCEHILASSVDSDNVFGLYIICELHQALQLQAVCLHYMKETLGLPIVIAHNDFKQLPLDQQRKILLRMK